MIPVQSGNFTVLQSAVGMRSSASQARTDTNPLRGVVARSAVDGKTYEFHVDTYVSGAPALNWASGDVLVIPAISGGDVAWLHSQRVTFS